MFTKTECQLVCLETTMCRFENSILEMSGWTANTRIPAVTCRSLTQMTKVTMCQLKQEANQKPRGTNALSSHLSKANFKS